MSFFLFTTFTSEIKICYKTSSFICISGVRIHILKLNKTFYECKKGMPSFYLFTTFTSEVKQMLHMYKYVLKHPFRQDIFKQTYRNVVFREYIFKSYYIFSFIYCNAYASLNPAITLRPKHT